MLITTKGHTAESLIAAVDTASALYGGNLTAEVNHVRGNQYRVKIGARDSYAAGSRTSWSGRHGRWACWHAFRDAVAAILLVDPDARVATSLAVYRGADGFLADYPATGDKNIGSLMSPAYMPDLCGCDG